MAFNGYYEKHIVNQAYTIFVFKLKLLLLTSIDQKKSLLYLEIVLHLSKAGSECFTENKTFSHVHTSLKRSKKCQQASTVHARGACSRSIRK